MAKQKMTPREVAVNRVSTLLGEVLTIIEAVVPPTPEDLTPTYTGTATSITYSSSSGTAVGLQTSRQNTQREAIKDLVRSSFKRAADDMVKWID